MSIDYTIYEFVKACGLVGRFLWELFKGIAPVAVAIAAIVINNKRSEERDKRSKKIEILLSWEQNLFKRLEEFNSSIDVACAEVISIINDFCREKISAKNAGDSITKITNELMRKGQSVIFLNESIQDKYGVKLNIPYFPYMTVELINTIQDSFEPVLIKFEALGEQKKDEEIDAIVNEAAGNIQSIAGKVKYTVTMVMKEMTEKMLEISS